MKKTILTMLSVFFIVFLSSVSINSFADNSRDFVIDAQGTDIAKLKEQLAAMDETIKKQQEMIDVLKDKIETKEEVAEIPKSLYREEGEIEQVIDNYLMKKETRKKMAEAGLVHNPYPFEVFWDKGLRFKSENGNFELKVGGRIMNDWGWFSEDNDVKRAIGDRVDGTEFRRARIYTSGTIYKNIGFKAQYDFEGGDVDFKDVYIELNKIPYVGHFRVGHFKEPFSLEELTSSKYITFMERSLNNVFAPARNTGFMLYNHALEERMTWAGGLFRNADSFGNSQGDNSTEGNYSFSGRLTGLPIYEDNGRKLVHVGLSYTYQNAFDNTIDFDSSPETHLADDFVDTGSFTAEYSNRLNPELAIVYGPFSFQGEYSFVNVELKRSMDSDPDFSGFYGYFSYFLTGENRGYKTKNGVFDRVKPNRNFKWGESPGAIELAVRYSELDLSDEGIDGGRLQDATFGINWYLNPNTRVMLNYVRANVDRLVNGVRLNDDNADLLSMRFQIDF